MGQYVNEQRACEAKENGKFLGKTEPCSETKWSWWEVYEHADEFIACVIDDSYGVSCGEKIQRSEFGLYMDEVPSGVDG